MSSVVLMAALLLQTSLTDVHSLVTYLMGHDDGYAGMEYVDLKLPSKTLWATCNLGASSPEQSGDFYAWGELQPKNSFSQSNYQPAFSHGSPEGELAIYPLKPGDQLSSAWDAAHVHWGADWSMPTLAQIQEICNNCHWTWSQLEGVSGYRVYSDDWSASIFLPASGMIDENGKQQNNGMDAFLWSREAASGTYDAGRIYGLYLKQGTHTRGYRMPYMGFTIRPVSRSVKARFDLNGDGKVTIADLTELIRQLAGTAGE